MPVPSMAEMIPVLQTAIGPVILISGIGLLLLSMTNRLGRAIDRARILSAELPRADEAGRARLERQLEILWARARMIRLSISLAAISALCAALLVIVLFVSALLSAGSAWLVVALFVACMGCLIAALVVFLHDINQSLAALKLELQGAGSVGRR
jgi:hypothetical protein